MWAKWTEPRESEIFTKLTEKCASVCLSAIPSPDSEDFVGEGEGRFPLGGLSDTADSLEKEKTTHLNFQSLIYHC